MDELDKKILDSLSSNSRQSVREIAKKIGTSAVTVLNRMKRLEKENIIKGYTAIIDYEKAGYDMDVLIKVRVSKGKIKEIGEKVKKHKSIFAIYDITGNFDMVVVGKFKNRKSMDAFIKKLQTYENVERTETVLILSTMKQENIRLE